MVIIDMFGAVGAMVVVVEAVVRFELLGDLVLLVLMYYDIIGFGVKYVLVVGDAWPRYGICGELSLFEIYIVNGGALKFDVEFSGCFVYILWLEGVVDVLVVVVDFLCVLRTYGFEHVLYLWFFDFLRLFVGWLDGGFVFGAVVDHVVVLGDLRIVLGMERAVVRVEFEVLVVAVCLEGVSVCVRFNVCQWVFVGLVEGLLFDVLVVAHECVRGFAAVVILWFLG